MASAPDDEPPVSTAPPEADATPRSLNRLEVLRGLRLSTWDGALATIWGTLTTGAFLTGFALWLGADSFAIGLLTAIPTLAGLVQIVSSYTSERSASRKRFTAICSLTSRLLWLPILILPLVLPRSIALSAFLALFALSYALANMPVPAWMSWMSDLVPPDHRGRYFGRRNMIAGFVGMLVGLPAAWFLDSAVKRHHAPALGFGVLFGAGVIGGVLSIVCLLRQPEPPRVMMPAAAAGGVMKQLTAYYRAPFADPNFRRLMTFNVVFGLGQYVAAPFYTVYALKVLGLNYVWLQVLATITSVASLASMPLWGYLTDKFGNKPLLAIAVCGVFTIPFTWMLTTRAHPFALAALLFEINIASGLFWAGVGLAQFNLLIGSSPRDKTPIYVASMAAVTGLTGGLAPLAGSAAMTALVGWNAHFLGLTLTNYHILFALSGLFRGAGLFFLRPLQDSEARSTRDVLRQLGRVGPRDWRNLRRLQRSGDAELRLRATEALGESRTHLASAELQAALKDPSLAVREEAARALGEIGDSDAVDALLAAAHDPASGITGEAARALGRLGDRRANPVLGELLNSPPGTLARRNRLTVARALGELGGVDAVDSLLAALDATQDEEMAETLIEALGRTGAARATPALLSRLRQSNIPRGLRLAVLRALDEIGDPASRVALRAELETTDDEAALPLLADALARLRDSTAVTPLLDRLGQLPSPTARKQVAHAIGRLIGQGDIAYSLLSHDEHAHDAALSRLMHELQRPLKGTPTAALLREAQESCMSGNQATALHALQRILAEAPNLASTIAISDPGLHEFLAWIARQDLSDPPAEIVLLTFCALRGLLD